jgi:hypothetical protein
MATCAKCGAKVMLPYQCRYCGGYFCPDHRLPENHECSRLPRRGWNDKPGFKESGQVEPKPKTRPSLHNFTHVLKQKSVIILLVFLVIAGIWAWSLLSASSGQLQAYRQFLNWALLIFGFAFIIGFMLTIPQRPRSVVRIRGEIEVREGAEVIIRAPPQRISRVSRRVAKWVLIIGGIAALIGLTYGISSNEFGYVSAGFGGGFLGLGVGLHLFRLSRYPE